MKITDELRKWVSGAKPAVVDGCSISVGIMTYGCKKALLAIADRIDAEYERIMHNLTDALHKQEDATRELDEKSVLLPKDADGVPFHIGDKVDSDHYEDGTVTGIQYWLAANGAIRELVAVRPHGWDVATWRDPEEYAHHYEPTVEDVLEDFYRTAKADSDANMGDLYETIAEYAAKLRLANDK